jgi:hypothetical protein
MKQSRRLWFLALIAVTMLAFAAPVIAQTALQDSEEGELVPAEPADSDLAPAEVAEEVAEEEADQPWTARYLIPSFIVVTILLIGGIVLYYFIAIKNRYNVVQS